MRRTSRATRQAPRRRESKTACAPGELLQKDSQKFPRRRCRPTQSWWRQTTQADGAVLTLWSFPVEHSEGEESLTSTQNGLRAKPSPTFTEERVAMERSRPRPA